MAPRQLRHNLWHICPAPPRLGHGPHVLQVPQGKALHLGKLGAQVRGQPALIGLPPAGGAILIGALVGDDPSDGVVFGLGHPEPVFGLDRDLAGDVVAAERPVRRQPGRGVPVALGGVGGPVDGEQVQRVVVELTPFVLVHLLGAFLPRI